MFDPNPLSSGRRGVFAGFLNEKTISLIFPSLPLYAIKCRGTPSFLSADWPCTTGLPDEECVRDLRSIFTCFCIHHWSSLSKRIMQDKVQEERLLRDGLFTCSPPLERAPPWTSQGTSLAIDGAFVSVLNLREPGFTLRTKNYCPINKGIRGL